MVEGNEGMDGDENGLECNEPLLDGDELLQKCMTKFLEGDELRLEGIAANDKPVSTGVFISPRLVLTSANPIREYTYSSLKVYTVHGMFNLSKAETPNCDTNPYWKKENPSKIWHGKDTKKHSPLHDLRILAFEKNVSLSSELAPGRSPYFTPVAGRDSGASFKAVWEWAGFGYIDEDHVESNVNLEVEFFEDRFVDCDEYIPRSWGLFFCVENGDNLLGVASGAPLYHQGKIYGIGSFAIQKGNDSLLVFTDVRYYNIKSALFCITEGEVDRIKWAKNKTLQGH